MIAKFANLNQIMELELAVLRIKYANSQTSHHGRVASKEYLTLNLRDLHLIRIGRQDLKNFRQAVRDDEA